MYAPKNDNGKIEWFGGNESALFVYRYLVDLAHIWDDMIDRDKPVAERDIHYAFSIPLVLLPMNPFWRSIEPEIRAMWVPVVMSYAVANSYEKCGDEHAIEIAHGLRYAVGQIFTYIITRIHGADEAHPILQKMWLQMMPERFDDYKKEHAHA